MPKLNRRLHRWLLAADGGWARGAPPWVVYALYTACPHAGDALRHDRGSRTAAGFAIRAIRGRRRPVDRVSTCRDPVLVAQLALAGHAWVAAEPPRQDRRSSWCREQRPLPKGGQQPTPRPAMQAGSMPPPPPRGITGKGGVRGMGKHNVPRVSRGRRCPPWQRRTGGGGGDESPAWWQRGGRQAETAPATGDSMPPPPLCHTVWGGGGQGRKQRPQAGGGSNNRGASYGPCVLSRGL